MVYLSWWVLLMGLQKMDQFGQVTWLGAQPKNIDTSVSCSVRCSLWIRMSHSPYPGAACFNKYGVYFQYVTKHAFSLILSYEDSKCLPHYLSFRFTDEYVASIMNYSTVFHFLVINFFRAVSCPCHCTMFVCELCRRSFHLLDAVHDQIIFLSFSRQTYFSLFIKLNQRILGCHL